MARTTATIPRSSTFSILYLILNAVAGDNGRTRINPSSSFVRRSCCGARNVRQQSSSTALLAARRAEVNTLALRFPE